MDFQKPYMRRSQSNDHHSSPGGSQEGDGRPARGCGPNGLHHYMHGKNARSADEDWFEGRMAEQARMKSPKGPTRKAGWNHWVSPSLRDTKSNSAASMTDSGKRCRYLKRADRIQEVHNTF